MKFFSPEKPKPVFGKKEVKKEQLSPSELLKELEAEEMKGGVEAQTLKNFKENMLTLKQGREFARQSGDYSGGPDAMRQKEIIDLTIHTLAENGYTVSEEDLLAFAEAEVVPEQKMAAETDGDVRLVL